MFKGLARLFGRNAENAPKPDRAEEFATVAGTIPSPEEFARRERRGQALRIGVDVEGTLIYKPDPLNKPNEWKVRIPLLRALVLAKHVGHEVVIATGSASADNKIRWASDIEQATEEVVQNEPRLRDEDREALLNAQTFRTVESKGIWMIRNLQPFIDVVLDDRGPGDNNWSPDHNAWLTPQAAELFQYFEQSFSTDPHQDLSALMEGLGFEMERPEPSEERHLRPI